jgi:cytochrome c553
MTLVRTLGIAGALIAATAIAQQVATAPEGGETAPAATEASAEAAPAGVAAAQAAPATWGDAEAGANKAAPCGACHGVDGNSADAIYPRLAGQHELYIARHLDLFQRGERENPLMSPMAAGLSPQDMRDIGAYFARQSRLAGVADDTPIASGPNQGTAWYRLGEQIYRGGNPATGVPACLGCHGPTGAGIPSLYPAVGGQHAAYTAAKLTDFRSGLTWGKEERQMGIMRAVSRNLSDEEIQALATYLQGLHDIADEAPAEAVAAAEAAGAEAAAAPATDAAGTDAAPAAPGDAVETAAQQ